VQADGILLNHVFTYYERFEKLEDFELGRIITPYAKFFPKTFEYQYIFDVTDFVQLLRDSADIRLFYSGYTWGFTATVDFHFIEGIPAREVLSVENIYNGYYPYGNNNNPIGNYLIPKNFVVPSSTASAKLRISVSGHGGEQSENCAEFCAKNYYLKLDNTEIATKLVWKDNCGSNAIINQGGTWIYDRANWCPGEQVPLFEYPLDVGAGTHTVDVDMDPFTASGSAGYQWSAQIVQYKAYAFTRDASVADILSPSKNFWYNRTNPVCDNPQVRIANHGSSTINSLDVSYQTGDGVVQTHTWTGNLESGTSAVVVLPSLAWHNPSQVQVFKAWISSINGQPDENPVNDLLASEYDLPQLLPSPFVIETRTNLKPTDNRYTVTNAAGNVVFSKSFSAANFLHRDTFNLPMGCYTFRFEDDGGNGLSFWNATADGSGTLRFVKNPINQTGPILKTFNSDFGNFVEFNFRVGGQVGFADESVTVDHLNIYPNPAADFVMVESSALLKHIALVAPDGRLASRISVRQALDAKLDISAVQTGMYLLFVTHADGSVMIRKMLINR
jgi:hypothetical protein